VNKNLKKEKLVTSEMFTVSESVKNAYSTTRFTKFYLRNISTSWNHTSFCNNDLANMLIKFYSKTFPTYYYYYLFGKNNDEQNGKSKIFIISHIVAGFVIG
jgi:hypothetical protein